MYYKEVLTSTDMLEKDRRALIQFGYKGNFTLDWNFIMRILHLFRNRDTAWVIGTKDIKIYDHLNYDAKWDVRELDPLTDVFKAAMHYVYYVIDMGMSSSTWVPVEERLPLTNRRVLVITFDGKITIGQLRGKTTDWYHENGGLIEVVKWQNLPLK